MSMRLDWPTVLPQATRAMNGVAQVVEFEHGRTEPARARQLSLFLIRTGVSSVSTRAERRLRPMPLPARQERRQMSGYIVSNAEANQRRVWA
jgi:hypothetical protein